jgi:excisionase family DNA binding protein
MQDDDVLPQGRARRLIVRRTAPGRERDKAQDGDYPRAQRMREIVERRRATRSQGGGDARVSSESDTPGMNWPAPLTVRELAAELRCSEEEVRALIRDGELQTVACGIRPGLVPRHQLDAYLRRLQHRLKESAAPMSRTDT